MPPDQLSSPPAFDDRRAYYRVTVVLPIGVYAEADDSEGEMTEKTVNISGGGIGVSVDVLYKPDDVLWVKLLLPDQVVFKACIEVVRVELIEAHHVRTYRLHGRFVKMTERDREWLVRQIIRFQRDHLKAITRHERCRARPFGKAPVNLPGILRINRRLVVVPLESASCPISPGRPQFPQRHRTSSSRS